MLLFFTYCLVLGSYFCLPLISAFCGFNWAFYYSIFSEYIHFTLKNFRIGCHRVCNMHLQLIQATFKKQFITSQVVQIHHNNKIVLISRSHPLCHYYHSFHLYVSYHQYIAAIIILNKLLPVRSIKYKKIKFFILTYVFFF